ncbi:MAG: 16S rRNA (cytosine(1402)-N(4))-methyltransferase RsmH [Chitinophagales bacterium]|nr:16S rRNA (cytosine(1402)-N(4))-methyltransferase RsmH [Chitinophagales bacterium]
MEKPVYHISVLLQECIDALQIMPDGNYVDLTFGGGGHSSEILKRLDTGKLFAFDQDEDAYNNVPENDRLVFVPHNFRFLKRFLQYHDAIPVQGILADLGISSYQIDAGHKGFSTRFEGPMDMRMNQEASLKASDILHDYSEEALVQVFSQYGEVRNSKTLAAAIVSARNSGLRFENTSAFISFLEPLKMGANPQKYYAQVFQALRIEVNDELNALKEMLMQSCEVLEEGGILAVITFHSLEDRLVKNFLKTGSFDATPETDEFGRRKKSFSLLHKKPIEASAKELKLNPRSRSAKLRVAQKLG